MQLIEVYAEKQPNGDVIITRGNGQHFATYPSYRKSKPTRRNKHITLNCHKWRLIWE